MKRPAYLIAVLALAGCGGGGGSAGSDASVDAAGYQIAAPATPAPPVLTPCPAGWREVDADGVTVCDAWPATGMAVCADDEAHFPGEPGCSRIGSACPAGEWPEGLPAGAPVLYVRAGGAPGGDGSMATPFGTISEATAAATTGTIVALGKGTFDEAVAVGAGVTVWGACVAETIVGASGYLASGGTFMPSSAGATVRNLQIGGERMGVFSAGTGRAIVLEDVLIAGAAESGVLVVGGASVTARGLVVRDTTSVPTTLRFGRGIEANQMGQLDVARAVLVGNRDFSLFVSSGATVVVADTAIVDTLVRESDGLNGVGVLARAGSSTELTRVVIERAPLQSLTAVEAGTQVVATDVVVRDGDGEGLFVEAGAIVTATRLLVERQRGAALFVRTAGTSVSITDLLVRDIAPLLAGVGGRGLESQDGTVAIERALFVRTTGGGLVAANGGTLALTDVVVRDVAAEMFGGQRGNGVVVQFGPAAVLTRVLIEGVRTIAVVARGANEAGTEIRPTSIVATDLIVRDTLSQESDGRMGRALNVQSQATADVTRALFERNLDLGVYASKAAVVRLTDVVIADTGRQECEATATCAWIMTASAGVYEDATLDARRFRFSASAFVGVQLASGGAMDLHQGELSGSPIGANVQTEGFDVARLQDDVVFVDNDLNLVSDLLDVPQPSGP